MTEESKRIFDAPWSVSNQKYSIDVVKSNGYWVCECETIETANRLARLPELYEELKSASYDFCWSCLATLGIDPPTADELIENLCPRKPSFCGYNNRWKLLQKVRDGE